MVPAGHAYAAAISACAVGSVWPRAVELFDEMMEVNIKPDVVSCTALISALGSDAQWERAERVVVWMHQVRLARTVLLAPAVCPLSNLNTSQVRQCPGLKRCTLSVTIAESCSRPSCDLSNFAWYLCCHLCSAHGRRA